jgi:hypothetical protein
LPLPKAAAHHKLFTPNREAVATKPLFASIKADEARLNALKQADEAD